MSVNLILHYFSTVVAFIVVLGLLFPKIGAMLFSHALSVSLETHKAKLSQDLETHKAILSMELENHKTELNNATELHRAELVEIVENHRAHAEINAENLRAANTLKLDSLSHLRAVLMGERYEADRDALLAYAGTFFNQAGLMSGILPGPVYKEILSAREVFDQDSALVRPDFVQELNSSLDKVLKAVNLAISEAGHD